jgi:catechol 2,3-dioxygenase-like lactoylglutathione lyase family enzyme
MNAPASVGVAQSFLKIFVADLERSSAFYAAALGLTPGGRMAAPMFDEVILRPPEGEPGGSLVLCRWRDERPLELGNARGPIGFSVVDVDAAYGRVLAAGGRAVWRPEAWGRRAWRSSSIPTAMSWSFWTSALPPDTRNKRGLGADAEA